MFSAIYHNKMCREALRDFFSYLLYHVPRELHRVLIRLSFRCHSTAKEAESAVSARDFVLSEEGIPSLSQPESAERAAQDPYLTLAGLAVQELQSRAEERLAELQDSSIQTTVHPKDEPLLDLYRERLMDEIRMLRDIRDFVDNLVDWDQYI